MTLPTLPVMPWGSDKSWHFLLGFPGGFAIALAAVLNGWGFPFLWVLVGGILVGVAKEAWDWLRNCQAAKKGLPPPHSVEVWDALATIMGFALGGGFIILVFY
jgi:hypothetical protein